MPKQLKFYLPFSKDDLYACCDALSLLGYEWEVSTRKSSPPSAQFIEPGAIFMTAVVTWFETGGSDGN